MGGEVRLTWVLPVVGVLLLAPYQSSEFQKSPWALVRWIGSPIASLSSILWNIKVIRKCALLSDISASFNMNFAKLEKKEWYIRNMLDKRDLLYIFSVMSQYTTLKSPIDLEEATNLESSTVCHDR